MEEQNFRFVSVSDEEGRIWDIYVISTQYPIMSYVVDFSALRLQEDFAINLVPMKHISSINELVNAMEKCLFIALSNFGKACPGYEKFLVSYSQDTNIRQFIKENKYMQALLNQLVFDALYEYYLKTTDKMVENEAAMYIAEMIYKKDKEINDETKSPYRKMLHTTYNDSVSFRDTIRKSMNYGLDAEQERSSAPEIQLNIGSMGTSPHKYSEKFEPLLNLNPEREKNLAMWVALFINQGNRFLSSWQYRKQFKSSGNNISKNDFVEHLWMNNIFRELFNPADQRNPKSSFEHTMVYHHIEAYKRLDFMLYLLEKCESNPSILHDIDNLPPTYEILNTQQKQANSGDNCHDEMEELIEKYSSLPKENNVYLQTSTPAAFLQRHVHKMFYLTKFQTNNPQFYQHINSHPSQLLTPILLEKALLDYALSTNQTKRANMTFSTDNNNDSATKPTFDYYEYFQRMKSYVILRNKAFEIFSADFTFGPGQDKESFTNDEYIEINKFIRENYSLIDFHNGITTWDTIKALYDKSSANTSEDKPSAKSRGPKVHISKNDKVNLLKKRMMILSSYLFPNIQP